MKKSDAEDIAGLLGQLGYPSNAKEFLKRIKQFKPKEDLLVVAVDEKKTVGFVSLHLIPLVHENGYLCRITALVVDKNHRRKGVGKKLVNEAEKHALKHGAVRSEITSSDKRIEAHSFYLEAGYKEYRKRLMKVLKLNEVTDI
jgi:GNAT superfamily N-acetyltransferase